ncbi:peptidase domain-containing ABC transporter [Pelagibacterium lacus]|uniref:Peptidase domain-containing ABC transporter n=1 Tax=Pelagibacterium lacus TaxID=2282655 RepID=A0A369W117_9HYPH|nr:peptidase domain-containing ABC transporter [Pelagibacterium lacus]RDE07647.1 peptidase domain-containing ABC transporter [Pelagibacterium lacus]
MSLELTRRISARFARTTPVVLQTEAAECGLACMAMIAARHGHRLDMPAMRRRFSASMKGVTMRDLIGIGADLKLATRALRLELDDLAKLRLPCVLHWEHNHFVVLTSVGARSATIHDPGFGRREVPLSEVSAKFTGVALEAWPTDQFEKRNEKVAIRIGDLVRRTTGIGKAAMQILAISLLLELAVIAAPIGFQLILDEVVVAADHDLLTIIALALALLVTLQVAAGFARTWMTMTIGTSLALQWKVGLFDHLMRLPLRYFERRHVGDVVSRFGSLDAVQRTLTNDAVRAFLDGIMSVALIAMMWLYGGWLIWVALASVALYALMRMATYQPYRALSEEAISQTAQENSHFMESVRGISSLKVLNLETRRREGWINNLVERVNAELRVQKFDAWFQAASTALFSIDRLLIIYFGIGAVLLGDLSVGMFVAFLAYKDQFASRINGFIDVLLEFRMLSLHGERIADIALSEPEEADDRVTARPAATAPAYKPAALDIRQLGFRYADNEPLVLDNLSFRIEAGECVGIAGPSGTGKSTLLKLISGLATPTAGQVLIDGKSPDAMGLVNYRHRIGCVLQDDRLFAGSIHENIAGFDPAINPDWIVQCAQMAAVHDEIMAMPMGYETLVGDMGSTLSGGQRQRIVLARAIARRPGLLLLDEATSHLDPDNECRINQAVRSLPMTRLVIAHRQSTLDATDRVLFLNPRSEDQAA